MAWARGVRGVAVACALGIAASLAACDAGGSPDGPQGSASPTGSPSSSRSSSASPGKPADLTFAVYGDDAAVAAYRRIAETFMAREPQVHIEVARYEDSNAVATAAVAGALPDVFLLDQQQLPELVASGSLAPLDEALDARGVQFGDDYQRSALTTFSANEQLQCMPVEMSPLVVYWNRELVPRRTLLQQGFQFPQGADPWGWGTFEAAARAVAEKDLLGPVKGTWLPPRLDLVTALLRSAGADVVDDDLNPTTLTLSSEGAVGAMASVVRLASDPAVSLTPADLARHDAVGWFTRGDLGMLIGTRADLPRLRAAAERRGLDFGVVSLPSFGRPTSISDATGVCVSADSPSVDAATDFVAWAVGGKASRLLARTGELVPARLATLTSAAFRDPGSPPPHPVAFLAGAKRSEPPPYSAQWPAVVEQAQDDLELLMSPASTDLGTRALARRLARMDEESQTLLGVGASAD